MCVEFDPALLSDGARSRVWRPKWCRQRRTAVPGGDDPLGHRRAVLEAVARPAADDPHDGSCSAAMKCESGVIS